MVKLTAVDLRKVKGKKRPKCIAQIITNASQGSKRYEKADKLAHRLAVEYRKKHKLDPNDVGVHIDLLFPPGISCKRKIKV